VFGGGPFVSDTVESAANRIVACKFGSPATSCLFGAPSYSPDGRMLVVSRLVPTDVSRDEGGHGALMLVGASGTGARMLRGQTRDDEDPAFLPSGDAIVFAGRTSPGGTVNLFEVRTTGTGLRQLTSSGGSQPAPCANGTIAFVKQGNIFVLSRDRRSQRRITVRGGTGPGCSPDSREIVFVSAGALYTIGSDGNNGRRLKVDRPTAIKDPQERFYVSAPGFSPAGRRIAFLASYVVPDMDETEIAVEVVGLKGHRARPDHPIADSVDFPDGSEAVGGSAGIAWQSRPR
jgi:WD40-like Beta Propeller Repeat